MTGLRYKLAGLSTPTAEEAEVPSLLRAGSLASGTQSPLAVWPLLIVSCGLQHAPSPVPSALGLPLQTRLFLEDFP